MVLTTQPGFINVENTTGTMAVSTLVTVGYRSVL